MRFIHIRKNWLNAICNHDRIVRNTQAAITVDYELSRNKVLPKQRLYEHAFKYETA